MTREDAKAFMRKEWRETMKGSYAEEAYEMAIKALEQPTIEPERKKGKWVGKGSEGFGIFICDNCGKLSMMEYDFCPNCGCRMEEGDK